MVILNKKIVKSIFAVLVLFAYTSTINEAHAQELKYLATDGTQTALNENATTVTSSTTNWSNGWYVVSTDVTIADRITVSSTVNLILCDGATLTASKGITVGSDATLNIYAQTDDKATMGALVASGANDNQQYNAGIGGVDNTAAGTITINGGKINATGKVGAGIGSGGQSGATVGTITINGGIVTAQDGDGYGAGIGGGGILGKAGTINLNGGIINAAGIGSGNIGGDCSMTVNISDGVKKIVATPVQGGACIGSGKSASGSVTVNFKSGGNVVTGDAKDAVFYDTGEGSQRQIRAKAMNHAVTMSDDLKANITATSEYAFTGETVTLTLGTAVDATTLSVNDGAVATTDAGNRQYTFNMPDEDVTVTATLLQTYAVSLPANMEVVSATNAADGNGKYISGTTVNFKASFPYAASDVSDGTNTLEPDANGIYSVTIGTSDVTISATIERSATIDLTDAPGDFAAINNDVLTGSTSHTVTIADVANITLKNSTITGGIVCNGTATITLVGTNSVSGATNKAGIQIGGSGTTLTIKGDGSLTANSGDQSAGIGLSRAWNPANDVIGGDIVIEGGTITANGSVNDQWGAGIGTGVIKGGTGKAMLGTITIKGGSVKATGGSQADGIGTGYTYSGCTNTIGAVTIYDGIDMVDASSIKDFANVVYKHVDGETETDVTSSASTYFTIIEDGDRRIIEKKDNTDYTITIADNSENGTIACAAATAKYGEKITITATPDFGYRLSRLVVKDAQNNDVASTGNSFFMPKSNVTVSAVFEQGVHGTTEFAWGYSGPDGFVTEATIYDGVTTVELQQGKSYRIFKYVNEYSYRKFHLDNDVYAASIPYTGGTGVFPEKGNATNFKVPNDGEIGFYDITMNDAGDGKWSVSILKTVAVMDAVPDQTYTGSEITPEPLVMAGSLNLTKGTDYEYSYTNNTNVGTAKVIATFQGDYVSLGSVEKEFTILPSTVMVSVTGSGTVTCGDRSATDGTSFGVMSEKGASVVLTLAPTDGNAVRSVEYGYTNNRGTTASGCKLPVSGTTATLTVPDDLKDGTGVTVTVTFAPALNGGADEASAVALTDATVTDLGGGWYKVENDITFDHTLNLLADTYLTIAEGKTMTVNTASGKAIDSEYTLNVSGAGALNITTAETYKIAVRVGSYVQTGATVTASGYIGIRCMDNFEEFNVTNDFTFSGGQLTATGSNSDGIWADNDISLSCTNATDFIYASSYSSKYGAVKIAEGKALTDGTNTYENTISSSTLKALTNVTLRPVTITINFNSKGGSEVDAQTIVFGSVANEPDAPTRDGYTFDGWYLNGSQYDFSTAVTDDIILMAVWKKVNGALTLTEYGDRTTATIDGSSNSSISIDDDIEVDEVTYTRTFESGSYTVMLPFGFTVDGTVNDKFYTLKSIDPISETVSEAKMSDPIETVEANKPYIFVPDAAITEIKISGKKTTLKSTVGAPLTNICENKNWKLHGVYDRKVWTDEDVNLYGFAAAPQDGISAGEFVHFVKGASLKPTRCYLEYSKDGFSKSAVELPEKIIVVFPDETSSVVEPGDPDDNGEIITPTAEITPNSGIKVWSADGSVIIEAQPDMDYTIVDLSGRILKNGVTHSTRETVTLSRRAAGIVIVKISNKTFKISY